MHSFRWARTATCLLLLCACSVPRGAALDSEVLAGAADEATDFALYPVTRAFLPRYRDWPVPAESVGEGWIGRHGAESSGDLRINPFDTLSLDIWDSEANSLLSAQGEKVVDIEDLRVTAEGAIFVPYIGYVPVAGRTPDDARQIIQAQLAEIVPSAQVQLSVEPGAKGSAILVGGVARPGLVALGDGHMTVLSLIGRGGGPVEMRNPQVRLIRGGRTYATSYASLLEDPARDTVLQGGDRVALVEDRRYFRALGATGRQDLIHFESETLTALDAIGLMEGLDSRRANLRGVLVLREYPADLVAASGTGPENSRAVFAMDLTSADGLFSAGAFRVLPGDTVLATEAALTSAEALAGIIGSFVGLSRSFTD